MAPNKDNQPDHHHRRRRHHHHHHHHNISPNFHAQLLNNRAAMLIKHGRYQVAIQVLVKALRITEKMNSDCGCYDNSINNKDDKNNVDVDVDVVVEEGEGKKEEKEERTAARTCQCQYCSLEFCIGYSRKLSQQQQQQQRQGEAPKRRDGGTVWSSSSPTNRPQEEKEGGKKTKEQQLTATDSRFIMPSHHSNTYGDEDSSDERSSPNCNYVGFNGDENSCVYQNPIRIAPQCMTIEGHLMGLTLPLILTFNLALSHHLLFLHQKYTMGQRQRQRPEADDDDDAKLPNGGPKMTEAKVPSDKLQKVLRLYELAYRWHMEDNDPQTDCVLFTMIIANNLAELHREAENYSKQKLCLQHLLSTLMFVVHACQQQSSSPSDEWHGEHDDTTQMVTSTEYDLFFRNTSQLMIHQLPAGAA